MCSGGPVACEVLTRVPVLEKAGRVVKAGVCNLRKLALTRDVQVPKRVGVLDVSTLKGHGRVGILWRQNRTRLRRSERLQF